MRIITLHVDGLEQAVKNGLYQWLSSADVDVVAIQNLKAKEYQLSDDVLYPEGFNAYFFDAAEDHYSGVAILTRDVPKAIMTGLSHAKWDMQGRFIQADFDHFSALSRIDLTVDFVLRALRITPQIREKGPAGGYFFLSFLFMRKPRRNFPDF